MTKNDIIKVVAEKHGMTIKKAIDVIDDFLNTMIEQIKKEERLVLPQIGIFNLTKSKARMGRNPQTGQAMSIPAKNRIKFSPAKSVRESINSN